MSGCSDGATRLLKAIAKEGRVAEVTGGDFISRHGLRAASSVAAAVKSLNDANLIYRSDGPVDAYFGDVRKRLLDITPEAQALLDRLAEEGKAYRPSNPDDRDAWAIARKYT